MPKNKDPYTTALTAAEERAFLSWAKQNGVRMEPGWNEDYDMRGYWKANPAGAPDARGHFPDTFKKPNHPTFSNESMYATPDAPRWQGTRLIDRTGRVIVDEGPEIALSSLAPVPAAPAYLPGGILAPTRKNWR